MLLRSSLLLTCLFFGCDSEPLCQPCGSVADGQLAVSGDSRLDGTFVAVSDLQQRAEALRDRFERDVTALAKLYGLWEEDRSRVDVELIEEITAAITADLESNLPGAPVLHYATLPCRTDPAFAYAAVRRCEAQRGCDGSLRLGPDVPYRCEGTCQGACEGCAGPFQCLTGDEGMACDGSCEGVCAVQGGTCDGTCRGTCDGTCSQTDANGACIGRCEGVCEGLCEVSMSGTCEGTCHGTCVSASQPSGCAGDLECAGACPGGCLGTCHGYVSEFDDDAACAEREACRDQALAQTAVNLHCPDLRAAFIADAGLTPEASPAFVGRLRALQEHGVSAMTQVHLAQVLLTGESGGSPTFEPAPLELLETQVTARAEGRAPGDVVLDIAPSREVCLAPALRGARDILGRSRERLELTVEQAAPLRALFVEQP